MVLSPCQTSGEQSEATINHRLVLVLAPRGFAIYFFIFIFFFVTRNILGFMMENVTD